MLERSKKVKDREEKAFCEQVLVKRLIKDVVEPYVRGDKIDIESVARDLSLAVVYSSENELFARHFFASLKRSLKLEAPSMKTAWSLIQHLLYKLIHLKLASISSLLSAVSVLKDFMVLNQIL